MDFRSLLSQLQNLLGQMYTAFFRKYIHFSEKAHKHPGELAWGADPYTLMSLFHFLLNSEYFIFCSCSLLEGTNKNLLYTCRAKAAMKLMNPWLFRVYSGVHRIYRARLNWNPELTVSQSRSQTWADNALRENKAGVQGASPGCN